MSGLSLKSFLVSRWSHLSSLNRKAHSQIFGAVSHCSVKWDGALVVVGYPVSEVKKARLDAFTSMLWNTPDPG